MRFQIFPIDRWRLPHSGGGVVRGIAASPIKTWTRGANVLDERRRSIAPLNRTQLDRLLPLLTRETNEIVETGIKVIDVMCPIRAGGSVALAGETGAGTTVVMEEIVRRIGNGGHPVTLLVLFPPTFFVGGKKGPWTAEELENFAPVDTLIHLSRQMILRKNYPGVDVMTTRSRLLDNGLVGQEEVVITRSARNAIGSLRLTEANPTILADPIALERARKVQAFFSQPFFVAEPYTKRAGSHVPAGPTPCVAAAKYWKAGTTTFQPLRSISQAASRKFAAPQDHPEALRQRDCAERERY